MDELASHTIWAIPVGAELLAELCLVEDRDISLDHHLSFHMGEGALVSVFAFTVKLVVLAHLGSELVDVGC